MLAVQFGCTGLACPVYLELFSILVSVSIGGVLVRNRLSVLTQVGFYTDAETGECEICAYDYFCPGAAPQRCNNQPGLQHTVTTIRGATDSSACVCGAGYTKVGNCIPCPGGYYKENAGDGVCTACEGTATLAEGAADSSLCLRPTGLEGSPFVIASGQTGTVTLPDDSTVADALAFAGGFRLKIMTSCQHPQPTPF